MAEVTGSCARRFLRVRVWGPVRLYAGTRVGSRGSDIRPVSGQLESSCHVGTDSHPVVYLQAFDALMRALEGEKQGASDGAVASSVAAPEVPMVSLLTLG